MQKNIQRNLTDHKLLNSSQFNSKANYPQNEMCHHLLTLKLFQTCIHFFVLLNTKEDFFLFHNMEVNGAPQLW